MSDVIVDLLLPDTFPNTQELVQDIAPIASLPMYDDEVILWHGDRNKARGYRKGFRTIEQQTGINFKRTRKESRAEISVKRGDPGQIFWTGVAQWSSSDPVWRLTVREGKGRQSTIIHEISHALGMDHPESHSRTTDTIMSYNRDKTIEKLFPRDIDILTGLYLG